MLTDNHFFVSSSWDKTIKVCRIDAPHTEILQINTKPREWHFDAKYSLDCKKIITSNTTNKSIHTFVVPKGVKGFVSDFMRNMHVIERFELPDGLLSIGNNTHDLGDIDAHCVFADCILPEVVIPDSVKEVGSFAFGHSHIESLQLSESLQSPYSRQFKL
jgi:hypothetical protein